jgi:hypothetical protein
MGKANEHERRFEDTGSTLWCYTVEAARSKSISVLIIDEAAFISDMDAHWAGLYPTLSTGGQCCVVSTVNGVGNWYEETYRKAQNKKNAFKIVDMDYWEHPEYNNPIWVEETRSNLGEKRWAQEVLRSFLGSGETFFSTKIIESLDQETRLSRPARFAFTQWVNTTSHQDNEYAEDGALWFWREPVDGREYILSADCAEGIGDSGDNSCFQILDTTNMEQVAEFYSNKIQPHVFAQIIHNIGYFYNKALVVIENMSQGNAVLSQLQHILTYENLYYDPKGKQDTPGLKTGKQNRPAFLEAMQNALTNHTIKINSRRLVNELNTFLYNARTKKPEATKGKHDDGIMALSMGLYIYNSQIQHTLPGEMPKEVSRVINSEMFEEIKREIMANDEDEFEDPFEDKVDDEDGVSTPRIVMLRRRNKLLSEFGW